MVVIGQQWHRYSPRVRQHIDGLGEVQDHVGQRAVGVVQVGLLGDHVGLEGVRGEGGGDWGRHTQDNVRFTAAYQNIVTYSGGTIGRLGMWHSVNDSTVPCAASCEHCGPQITTARPAGNQASSSQGAVMAIGPNLAPKQCSTAMQLLALEDCWPHTTRRCRRAGLARQRWMPHPCVPAARA